MDQTLDVLDKAMVKTWTWAIVDDHTSVLGPVCFELERTFRRMRLPAKNVGQYVTIAEALRELPLRKPDVVVVDWVFDKQGQNHLGGELVRALSGLLPDTKWIVWTGVPEDDTVEEALSVGVSGIVDKGYPLEGLAEAIIKVMQGEKGFSPQVQITINRIFEAGLTPPSQGLTATELEVLRLTVEGVEVKAGAVDLGMAVKTFRNHITNIKHKTGTTNNVQLIHYAHRHRLVKP